MEIVFKVTCYPPEIPKVFPKVFTLPELRGKIREDNELGECKAGSAFGTLLLTLMGRCTALTGKEGHHCTEDVNTAACFICRKVAVTFHLKKLTGMFFITEETL